MSRQVQESSRVVHARADQAALADALALILGLLRNLAGGGPGEGKISPIVPAPDSTLAHLVEGFGLTPFETRMVLIAVGVELEPEVGRLCASIADDEAQRHPTFGWALRHFEDAHWDAFSPEGPLRGRRILSLDPGPVLLDRAIHIEERVLHALMGVEDLDPTLARRLRSASHASVLSKPREVLASQVARAVAAGSTVHLVADSISDGLAVAEHVAGRLHRRAYLLRAEDLPSDAAERDELERLWSREAVLAPVALILVRGESADVQADRSLRSFVDQVSGPAMLVSREVAGAGAARFRVPIDALPERIPAWREILQSGPKWARGLDAETIEDLAAQFSLSPEAVSRALAAAKAEMPRGTASKGRDVLWGTLRREATPKLDDLAQRVDARATFEDLVLPEEQTRALRAIAAQIRHKAQVQYRWGFAEKSSRGHGTTVVFAGPSGTGKTMGAEVLAKELELDLFRVDLSSVISKYIGETEENLRKVFDAAESGGAILLFDEADALFGKRTEVKDSHDRHANVEVSYLLQRMEAYGGLAILTTNMKKSIDEAFFRRMQFVIDFPFPEAPLRERIWRGIFPKTLPTQGLDYARLGQLSVPGGNIRSIARNAAFFAADAGTPVTMAHLLDSARLEYAKLGRSLPPAEVRGWV